MGKRHSTEEERLAARKRSAIKYRVNHPERLKKSRTDYKIKTYLSKRMQRCIYAAKSRAKEKNVGFDITEVDLVVPEFCPVLGIPLYEISDGRDNRPSLDRIDNTKGYTKDNVIVISLRANRLKSDASLEELNNIVDFYNRLAERDDRT